VQREKKAPIAFAEVVQVVEEPLVQVGTYQGSSTSQTCG
jgi:hypothetical protein